MSKDKITGEKIYNLEVRFVNKDKSKCFKYPHRIKFYENDGCSVDIIMPNIWFEHKDLDKYVGDLEAKLAEKEEKINMLEEHKFYADNIIQAYADKCKKYEQQLAEKEVEIDGLKISNKFYKDATEQLSDECNELEELLKKQDQDKISFAVAELEKARKYVDGRTYLAQYLDERVNQLKEGK